MGGLVAVFARDGSAVEVAEVDEILRRQAHRGPDGLRIWCDGPIGLGHAALNPTGAGTAVELLVNDGGHLAIVGDLRIDNRRDLVDGLDLSPRGAHDAEIVLAAYRRWGVDVPRHLEGAFAFAIWDAIEQRILCARDHLGAKPFTYHLSRRILVCASEAEAVPCHRQIPRRINEARIADFLVSELEGVDHTSSFFEGVVRLPPAHFLVVEPEGHRLRRYWQPDVESELRLGSDDDYAEAFEVTFCEAVKSCLTEVVHPALLLSGGIDSNAIAAFAGSLAGEGTGAPLTTFSVIDKEHDPSPETASIIAAIEALGMDARCLSPAMVAGLSPSVRRSLLDCGEPFDGYMVPNTLLFSMAADTGSRMVLDGIDGDIVTSTPIPTAHLLRQGRALRAWREAAAHRQLFPGAPHPLRVLTGGAFRAWTPRGVRGVVGRFRNRRDRAAEAMDESLIDRDFACRVGLGERLEELWNRGRDDSRGNARAVHGGAVTHPYVAAALERYDRVAARCGVEARHPFFDLRLVKLCLSLPWNLKVRDGWTKFILRLATEGKVVDEIRWRHDFCNVLWRPTSRVIAQEKTYLRSILHEHEVKLAPYVDYVKLEQARRALDGNPNDQDEVWIWEASTLALWLTRSRS